MLIKVGHRAIWKKLLSPLDSKEIKPVNPKGNQPWIFTGRIDAWGHLGCSSPTSCPADTMCNRVEPSLLSLAWTPDLQCGQKHDWCFKLLEQTNEKWHWYYSTYCKVKHAFSPASFVVHEFLHVDLFDCLLPLALGEEAWKFTGNRVFCSVRTQLINHL